MKVKLIKTRTYTTHINYMLWARRKSGFQKCAHHINKLIKIDFTVNRCRHHSYFLASISIHIGAENSWMCMKVPGPVLRGAPCLMKASLISVQSKAPVRTGQRLASLVDGHVCGYCCCARTTCHSFFVVVFVPCYVEITLKKKLLGWILFCHHRCFFDARDKLKRRRPNERNACQVLSDITGSSESVGHASRR